MRQFMRYFKQCIGQADCKPMKQNLSPEEVVILEALEDGEVWDLIEVVRSVHTLGHQETIKLHSTLITRGLIKFQKVSQEKFPSEPDRVMITPEGLTQLARHRALDQ